MQPPGAILISGIPGAGKTTVSRLLAARFPRSAHIEGDLLGHYFVVGGLVPPQGPPAREAGHQLRLRRRNIALLADSFAKDGFLPVIDDVVTAPSVLTYYRRLLGTRPLRLVQLTPSLDIVAARDASRDKHVFDLWQHLDQELRTVMPRVGLWLDSSELSAEQTVDTILAHLDETVVDQEIERGL